jgi:hypothetical protein
LGGQRRVLDEQQNVIHERRHGPALSILLRIPNRQAFYTGFVEFVISEFQVQGKTRGVQMLEQVLGAASLGVTKTEHMDEISNHSAQRSNRSALRSRPIDSGMVITTWKQSASSYAIETSKILSIIWTTLATSS